MNKYISTVFLSMISFFVPLQSMEFGFFVKDSQEFLTIFDRQLEKRANEIFLTTPDQMVKGNVDSYIEKKSGTYVDKKRHELYEISHNTPRNYEKSLLSAASGLEFIHFEVYPELRRKVENKVHKVKPYKTVVLSWYEKNLKNLTPAITNDLLATLQPFVSDDGDLDFVPNAQFSKEKLIEFKKMYLDYADSNNINADDAFQPFLSQMYRVLYVHKERIEKTVS